MLQNIPTRNKTEGQRSELFDTVDEGSSQIWTRTFKYQDIPSPGKFLLLLNEKMLNYESDNPSATPMENGNLMFWHFYTVFSSLWPLRVL